MQKKTGIMRFNCEHNPEVNVTNEYTNKYGEKKKALKEIAQKRFPELNLTLDTCDAALIAEYGRRCLLYEIHNP